MQKNLWPLFALIMWFACGVQSLMHVLYQSPVTYGTVSK